MDNTRRFLIVAQVFVLLLLFANVALAWIIPALLQGTAG
jgi:hypothetical protein